MRVRSIRKICNCIRLLLVHFHRRNRATQTCFSSSQRGAQTAYSAVHVGLFFHPNTCLAFSNHASSGMDPLRCSTPSGTPSEWVPTGGRCGTGNRKTGTNHTKGVALHPVSWHVGFWQPLLENREPSRVLLGWPAPKPHLSFHACINIQKVSQTLAIFQSSSGITLDYKALSFLSFSNFPLLLFEPPTGLMIVSSVFDKRGSWEGGEGDSTIFGRLFCLAF